MDESHFLNALRPYYEAFAETDERRRLELLRTAMTEDAEIWGPKRVFAGHEQISEKIAGFHLNWPGCRLVLATGLNIFLNSARLGGAIVGIDGAVRARGDALVELAPDGRIQRVIPYWDPLPPLPTAWPRALAVSSEHGNHVRHGVGSVRPYLHGPLSLLEFVTKVFGAEEVERHEFGPESFHVEVKIGDSMVVIEAGELPADISSWTNAVYVYVPDVDATYERAMALGAEKISEPIDKPYQERQAGFRDSAGNTWWVGTFKHGR